MGTTVKLLVFHTTGNANVKSALEGFERAGILKCFYVTIAVTKGDVYDTISRLPGMGEIRRRKFADALKPYANSYPWYEFGRMAALKFKLDGLVRKRNSVFFIDRIVQKLDSHVARLLSRWQKRGVNGVYGYEDLSIQSFTRAKKLGLRCYYDLPIGYWRSARKYLDAEQERWPEWVSTMPSLSDWPEKLSRKDEELKMADAIFVASSFTASTLSEYPGQLAPVHVIPYGFPMPFAGKRSYRRPGDTSPVKLLFVGSLSQRKGIADMFAAVSQFGNAFSLTVVGTKPAVPNAALNAALDQHTWIESLPHEEILALMRQSDILLFPSLFEGFGLVITEAMSQGTPVITTNRTAGPDLITPGKDGWLIEAGSTEALVNCLQEVLDTPEKIEQFGKAALQKAASRPWEVYGRELAAAIQNA